jgi:hypothetical protein
LFSKHGVTQSWLEMADVKRRLDGLNRQHNYKDSLIKMPTYQILKIHFY